MFDRHVVSKSRMISIPCDGPLKAQVEKCKLEEEMKAAGYPLDVEVVRVKPPRPRALAGSGRKPGHK